MLTVSVTLLPSLNVHVKSSSYVLSASMTVTTPIIVHMLKNTQETNVHTCVKKKSENLMKHSLITSVYSTHRHKQTTPSMSDITFV